MLEKFDSVGADTLYCADLRDHSGGNLNAQLVSHDHGGSDRKFTMQLYGGSAFVQVGRLRVDGERNFVTVVSGQPHGRVQRHPVTAAFGESIANQG